MSAFPVRVVASAAGPDEHGGGAKQGRPRGPAKGVRVGLGAGRGRNGSRSFRIGVSSVLGAGATAVSELRGGHGGTPVPRRGATNRGPSLCRGSITTLRR